MVAGQVEARMRPESLEGLLTTVYEDGGIPYNKKRGPDRHPAPFLKSNIL